MTEISVENLKANRKKANDKCKVKCSQVEEVVESIGGVDFESDEEIVQWIRVAKDAIKIKDVDEQQA